MFLYENYLKNPYYFDLNVNLKTVSKLALLFVCPFKIRYAILKSR